ncbi:hypothetical protein HY640_03990 [Candidatus Woesearchaeota archaeon]|nr:hypothetical protein [Candidatus Woesearchaeota archaeon]
MSLKKPDGMDECVYFTQRSLGDNQQGFAMVWVFRQNCPKCGKALMGKPRDKGGKVLVRAREYACPSCGHRAEKAAYEESLTANIEYNCPSCGFSGEKQMPFKRRKVEGVDTLRFKCDKCAEGIDVTKKMKNPKAKDF